MAGNYSRTAEIRLKQSNTMKKVVKSYNFEEIDKKRKKTMLDKGIRSGRKPGSGRAKTGIYMLCPVCQTTTIYYTKKEVELKKRKTCSKTCLFKDPVYRQKLCSSDKSYMQTEEYKNSKRNPNTPSYRRYANIVRKLSEKNYVKYKNKINPNNYPRTLCGVDGGYQLDHIKSIKECWNNGITPEEAAHVNNLTIIPWQQNLKKRKFNPILNYVN